MRVFFQKRFKKLASFSVIEMLVVAGVITIVSALVIANVRSGQRQAQLRNASEQIAQLMGEAKSRALGLVIFEGSVPRYGYGIYIDLMTGSGGSKKNVMLFAGRNQTLLLGDRPASMAACVSRPGSGAPCVKLLTLPPGIVIKQAYTRKQSGEVPTSWLHVRFAPEGQTVSIFKDFYDSLPTEARIEVAFENDLGTTKNIIVKKTGEITIQ